MDELNDNMIDQQTDPSRLTMVRPSWADPLYILATSWARKSVVTINPGSTQQLAQANSLRFAIGFGVPTGGGVTPTVGPYSDSPFQPWSAITIGTTIWFHMFTYGAFVQLQWYAVASGPVNITVFEQIIK